MAMTELEKALLGDLVVNFDPVPAEIFTGKARQIYEAMQAVATVSGGRALSSALISAEAAKAGVIVKPETLDGWALKYAPMPEEQRKKAIDTLAEQAWRKRAKTKAGLLVKMLDDPKADRDIIANTVADIIAGDSNGIENADTAADALTNMLASGYIPSLQTGISKIDRFTGGLFIGEPNFAAARPGQGKTLFALQVAWHVIKQGGRVLYVLGESTADMLIARMAFARAGVDFTAWQAGKLSATDTQAVIAATKQIKTTINGNLDVQVSNLSPAAIGARMSAYDLTIIDHLEHLRLPPKMKKVQGLEWALETLREANKASRKTLLILQQLNRSASGNAVGLEDLRYTGYSEQVAARVFFLRPDNDTIDPDRNMKIVVGKNRYGEKDLELSLRVDFKRQWIYQAMQPYSPFS